jgi:hypothetical protein
LERFRGLRIVVSQPAALSNSLNAQRIEGSTVLRTPLGSNLAAVPSKLSFVIVHSSESIGKEGAPE